MGKMKRTIKWLVRIGVVLLVLDAAMVLGFASFQRVPSRADDAVVLGAAMNSPALVNRSFKALELYQNGRVGELVLSGGRISDRDMSEAGFMRMVIVQNGGPEIPLVLDEKSRNTYENIRNTRQKIGTQKSIVIVSDEFHLARGVLLAWRAGYRKVYWTAPYPYYYSKHELLFYYGREIIAILSYVPRFIFG